MTSCYWSFLDRALNELGGLGFRVYFAGLLSEIYADLRFSTSSVNKIVSFNRESLRERLILKMRDRWFFVKVSSHSRVRIKILSVNIITVLLGADSI